MSATLRLRNALVWVGSGGVASVTAGLSPVGPPPTLRMSQLLASRRITGSRSSSTLAPEHRPVKLTGPVLVADHQEVRHHQAALQDGKVVLAHRKPPARVQPSAAMTQPTQP